MIISYKCNDQELSIRKTLKDNELFLSVHGKTEWNCAEDIISITMDYQQFKAFAAQIKCLMENIEND